MISDDQILTACQQWVEQFIVQHSICPFARPVVESQQLGYKLISATDTEQSLIEVMGQIQQLQVNEEPETLLMILPAWKNDFNGFLNVLDIANVLLDEHDLKSTFQLASFHPEYLFEGEPEQDCSHYTNRSPWPMIHIIRQQSISNALKSFANPERIPERNIDLMNQLGKAHLKTQLEQLQGLKTDEQ